MRKKTINYISKLDAAKRQLEIAVRLFMSNSDIVAIHSLTAAAHSILNDLLKKQGKKSYVDDVMFEAIKPKFHSLYRNKINEASNFFKHADKDPNRLLRFLPGQTEMLLWDACAMYQNITSECTPLIFIYRMWFFAKNPDLLLDSKMKTNMIKCITDLNLDFNNRNQFLNYLPEVTKL